MEVGGRAQYTALLTDENGAVVHGAAITWTTDNLVVASVDENGVVTGFAGGSATVRASAAGLTGGASFHVVPAITFCKPDGQLDSWCRLTDGPNGQLFPSVSGNRVVFVDQRAPGNQAIVLLDLTTGDTTTLTPDNTVNIIPTIDGDRVIYVRLPPTGNWQLLTYDLNAGQETQFGSEDRNYGWGRLALSGHRAAWHMNRNNNWDIYTYDFETHKETRVTTDPADQADPAVFGDRVTWSDKRQNGTWWDLYTYDLTTGTETRLTEATTMGRGSAIFGNRIVWGDTRQTLFSLYEYDFDWSDHEHSLLADSLENSITMWGSRVAWESGTGAIYGYDLDAQRQVRVTNLASSRRPWISQDYLVWEDDRNGNTDIYIARLADIFRP
jgi:beta propeller repeat protein